MTPEQIRNSYKIHTPTVHKHAGGKPKPNDALRREVMIRMSGDLHRALCKYVEKTGLSLNELGKYGFELILSHQLTPQEIAEIKEKR